MENDNAGIYADNGSEPAITDTALYGNATDGFYASSTAGRSRSVLFADSSIQLNGGHPVVIPADYAGTLDSSCHMASDGGERVLVIADTLERDATWQALGAPFQVTGDIGVQGDSAPRLVIEAGVTLQLDADAGLAVGQSNSGSLEATAPTSVIELSSSSSSPAAGDWDGILLGQHCDSSKVDLEGLWVGYGGGNGRGNIWSHHCGGSIADSYIAHSSAWGIHVDGGAPTLTNITYAGNTSGDLGP